MASGEPQSLFHTREVAGSIPAAPIACMRCVRRMVSAATKRSTVQGTRFFP